jgi:hypothetical protein
VLIKASDTQDYSPLMRKDRTVTPDFVLIRNFPADIHDNRYHTCRSQSIIIPLIVFDCAY